MNHEASTTTVMVFAAFVAFTLALSFYFARRSRSAAGYFAAGGQIHWFVNGVAFAGDYLSAASFLGICGMIAINGYDGFLYSIGYLAGWVVALFVIAEPLKRLGKYTFADALDARFQSRSIKLSAGISTLAVSVFYLIPQMVGAGALVQPLLGFRQEFGVVMVGAVVVLIVSTAGMVSTTYVQFLKGSLLVLFSSILTVLILMRGLSTVPGDDFRSPRVSPPLAETSEAQVTTAALGISGAEIIPPSGPWAKLPFVRTRETATGQITVWRRTPIADGQVVYYETQTLTKSADGKVQINGQVGDKQLPFYAVGQISKLPGGEESTGPVSPLGFLRALGQSEILSWRSEKNAVTDADSSTTTIFYPQPTAGRDVLRPGNFFTGLRDDKVFSKLNFLSLMLALFCGTASLPHILIRYYTVKDQASARKSTVVGIGSIGFFYVLTLFMGLGAMVNGVLDVTDTKGNMAAPLLARDFGETLFALISAIAFTTVLGTVSGLIVASSGAVVHDLLSGFGQLKLTDHEKVRIGRIAAAAVGVVAIGLGILFKGMNVSFLVGWAFSVAASANLPSLVMLLFWKGTTKQGITAAIIVGMVSSLAWILLSGDTFRDIYGISADSSPVPFSQPGLVTIPLGFVTLIVVSLLTKNEICVD